jgi:hypothetical protein
MATIDTLLDVPCDPERVSPSRFARRPGDPWRQHLIFAGAALALIGICAAAAQDRRVAVTAPMVFHIPAQPLVTALQAYGQQTGVQVLYESHSATGQNSVAVDGNFLPEEALTLLLSGTELKVRYTQPDAITLALPFSEQPVPLGSSSVKADLSLGTLRVRAGSEDEHEGSSLRDYNESVQADVQKALRRNGKIRNGSYRLVVDLWVDPSRTIERTKLYQSTGDSERDAAVESALRGVTLTKPAPANTPQPVRIAIVVRSMQ